MHTCKTCGHRNGCGLWSDLDDFCELWKQKTCSSCRDLDMSTAYLTDPPQYKCKKSGRLHFQSDICDMTQEDEIGNQTGGQNMKDKEVRKAIRFLAVIIDKALGQTDCALSYKEWDMLRNLKDGNYGGLDE